MRIKLATTVATIVIMAIGFLSLTVTANKAFAISTDLQQTVSNGLSSVTQSSTQILSAVSGTSTTNSANQLVINSNQGHTVSSTILSDQIPVVGGTSASAISTSSITQSNTQTSSINSGASTTNSANQLVINSNQGHTVSSTEASSP